jgi:hypothetical protein
VLLESLQVVLVQESEGLDLVYKASRSQLSCHKLVIPFVLSASLPTLGKKVSFFFVHLVRK